VGGRLHFHRLNAPCVLIKACAKKVGFEFSSIIGGWILGLINCS
jgi:hypothetical protein